MTYLYHHGILGQRWGKKNGPPYPLDPEDHSAREKKMHWKKSLDKDSNDRGSSKKTQTETDGGQHQKKGLSSRQKKALVIGGVILATAAVAGYGYYKYKNNNQASIDRGQLLLDDALERKQKMKINDLLNEMNEIRMGRPPTGGLATTNESGPFSLKSAAEKVGIKMKETIGSKDITSPEFRRELIQDYAKCGLAFNRTDNSNPNHYNCTLASTGYLLRRMGLDVEPKQLKSFDELNHVEGIQSILRNFKGSFEERVVFQDSDLSLSSVKKKIEKLKDEIRESTSDRDHAYGYLLVHGSEGKHGHAMVFEKIKDNVMILNPQNKIDDFLEKIMLSGQFSQNWGFISVDQLEPRLENAIKYVENATSA